MRRNALCKARERRGWSLRQVSKKTGISLTRLWNIEQGHHEPKISAAFKLARTFRTDVRRLFREAA
jgi:transcriptional regulator with XRE-family HTH domain